jgi:hypothetical protein
LTKPLQNVKNEKGNVSVFKRQKQNEKKTKGIVKAGRHYIHVLYLETAGKDDWITHSNGKETKEKKKGKPDKGCGSHGWLMRSWKGAKTIINANNGITPPSE